eukprot:gene7565-11586_t
MSTALVAVRRLQMVIGSPAMSSASPDEGTVSLPTYDELKDMPEGLQEEVRRMALQRLRSLLVPRCRLWLAAHTRKVTENSMHHDASASLLATHRLTERWPLEVLRDLVISSKPVQFMVDDNVLEAGGLMLLHEGSVFETANGKQRRRILAPVLLGGDNVLTDDPTAPQFVAAATCRGSLIHKRTLLRGLSSLPRDLQDEIWPAVFESRKRVLRAYFKLTREGLRSACCLFQHMTDLQLDNIGNRLVPVSYKAGVNVLKEPGRDGKEAKEGKWRDLVLLRRGEAEVQPDGLPAAGAPLMPGQAFGELGLVFGGRKGVALRTKTLCDFWVLSPSALKALTANDADLAAKVHTAAHLRRLQYLAGPGKETTRTSAHLKALLRRAPMLRDLNANDSFFDDVCASLQPEVFVPGHPIASAVDVCDRLLVFSRGKALVRQKLTQQPAYVETGDVIGYTCLAEHRWLFPVAASSTCDVWKIDRNTLYHVLLHHGLIKAAAVQTRKLLVLQGGVARLARTETEPPLLHPIKGLPAGVGHVMSYHVRSPEDLYLASLPAPSYESAVRQSPPGLPLHFPASEAARIDGRAASRIAGL